MHVVVLGLAVGLGGCSNGSMRYDFEYCRHRMDNKWRYQWSQLDLSVAQHAVQQTSCLSGCYAKARIVQTLPSLSAQRQRL